MTEPTDDPLDALFVLRDYSLVRVLPRATHTKSGIAIPETVTERPYQGVVLKVGPGVLTEMGAIVPLALSDGDLVYFNKFGGIEFDPTQPTLLLVRYDEIAGGKKAGRYTLITHDNGAEHLAGEGCAICDAPAREAERLRVEAMRAEFLTELAKDDDERDPEHDPELHERLAALRTSVGE